MGLPELQQGRQAIGFRGSALQLARFAASAHRSRGASARFPV